VCVYPSFIFFCWRVCDIFLEKNKRATSFICYYIFPRLIPLPRPVYSRQQKECVQYYYIEKVTSGLFIHISRFFPIFVFFNIFLSIESKKELIYCPTPLHLSIYLSVARNKKNQQKKTIVCHVTVFFIIKTTRQKISAICKLREQKKNNSCAIIFIRLKEKTQHTHFLQHFTLSSLKTHF